MNAHSPPVATEGALAYPEWPGGLGDPRLHVSLLDNRTAPRGRPEVIARFRAVNEEARGDATMPRRRPQLRQFYPIKLETRRCSFQVKCKLAVATKQCFSCAKFDDKRLGFYCDACFDARHPAYRLDHSWTPIQDVTNQEEDWVAHVTRHHLEQDAAEVKLLLDETHSMLAGTSSAAGTTAAREDAPTRANRSINFQQAFDRVSTAQVTLRELMGRIQSELAEAPALSREEALGRIQRMWKLRKARKQLTALVREVYASFVDPETGKTYYYNARTKTTQWVKPKALGSGDLEPLAAVDVLESEATKHRPTITFATREEQERYAAKVIQAMARAHAARRQLRRLISSVYEKIWDADSQRFYYHNTKTREVKWVKPRWVSDADLLTPRSRSRSMRQFQSSPSADGDSSGGPTSELHYATKKTMQQERDHPLTETEAASMVQGMYRRRVGFRKLLELCRGVYERIYDAEQQTYYYHNTRTKETTWAKPLLLRGARADVFTPRTRRKRMQVVHLLTSKPRQWTEDQAAARLQGLFRARQARQALAQELVQRYKKALDTESGQFYYVNVETMEVSWEPPALVRRANAELTEFGSD